MLLRTSAKSLRWHLVVLIPLSILAGAEALQGQAASESIKVRVSVTDTGSGGVLASAFMTAFRSLGDIEVVHEEEWADYVLSAVVLCTKEDCRDPTVYYVAVRFSEPMSESILSIPVYSSLSRGLTPAARIRTADSIVGGLYSVFKRYEVPHQLWIAAWGRARYQDAIREFIGTIDAQCFEKVRALRRQVRLGAAADWPAYDRYVASHSWIC